MKSSNHSGRIITFYSYKGGTGRSMALANVAWILASAGKRVLTVDWDLEAPGLHRYFAPFLNDREMTSTDGLIDFIVEYSIKASGMAQNREQAPEGWFTPYTNILRYATSLKWDFPGGGSLDIVSAGRQGSSYSTRVNSFSWQNFYDVLGGGSFLEAVKERVRAEYDYALIDSRTGLSDTSGICTVQMPDTLVVCFTLNNQSIDGTAAVAASAYEQRKEIGLRIFPVPTRTDAGEKERLEVRREYARDKFDSLLGHLPEEARDAYWGEVEVPYVAFYAYEETIAAFVDKPEQHVGSILAPSKRLAAHLSGGESEKFVAPTEAQRSKVQAQFAGDPLITFDLFLSHSAKDEWWAGRLAKHVTREKWRGRKLKVFLPSRDVEPGRDVRKRLLKAASKSRKVAVVITPDNKLPAQPAELLGPQADTLLKEHRVIALYRRTAAVPEWMTSLPYIDFRDDTLYAENLRKLLTVVRREQADGEALPQLAKAARFPAAIPRPAFGFVSRSDREGRALVEMLSEMLGRSQPTTVALWGAGGVGKSVLAAEVARRAGDLQRRVVWVSTEQHADFSLVIFYDEILNELNKAELLPLPVLAKAEALRPLLVEEPTLVVLDAFENVSPETQKRFGDLLSEDWPCPLIITSRQRVDFARNVPIYNFTEAEAREFVARWESSVFGDESGANVDPSHVQAAAEGNPLAMKLLLAQLEETDANPYSILAESARGEGNALTRVFEGVFRRLTPGEGEALLALSLFVPSASRQSLSAVADMRTAKDGRVGDTLAKLSRLHLARATDDGTHFSIGGTTHELAAARLLQEPVSVALQERFVRYFVGYAEAHDSETPEDFSALNSEKENLLRAMDLAFRQEDWEGVVRLGWVIALRRRWLHQQGYLDEAIKRCELGASAAEAIKHEGAAVAFTQTIEYLHRERGELEELPKLYARSLGLFERLGSDRHVAALLMTLARYREFERDYLGAIELYERSLQISSQKTDYPDVAASASRMLGILFFELGEEQKAEEYVTKALSYAEKSGDKREVAAALSSLSDIVVRRRDYERARPLVERSLELWRDMGNKREEASDLLRLGDVFFQQEKLDDAEKFYVQGIKTSRELDDNPMLAYSLVRLGDLALKQGAYDKAREAYIESLTIERKIGQQSAIATILSRLGSMAHDMGMLAEARKYLEEGLEVSERLGDLPSVGQMLANLGVLAASEGNSSEAERLLREALSIFEKIKSPNVETLRSLLKGLGSEGG